jgi:hypothetical protein
MNSTSSKPKPLEQNSFQNPNKEIEHPNKDFD